MNKVENRVQELWDEAVAEGIRADEGNDSNIKFSTREDIAFYNSEKGESSEVLRITSENLFKVSNDKTFNINKDFVFVSKNKSDDIFNYFKKIGGIAQNPDIGTVELNRSGSKSTLFHGFGKEKLASVFGIKNVIEKGTIINHTKNYNNKGYDRYFICGKGTLFNNNNSYLSVVVKSYPDNVKLNNKFYLHEVLLLEAKKETDSHILTGTQKSESPVSESASNNNILQSTSKSNSSSQQNSDRFDTDYFDELFDMGEDLLKSNQMIKTANPKVSGFNINC